MGALFGAALRAGLEIYAAVLDIFGTGLDFLFYAVFFCPGLEVFLPTETSKNRGKAQGRRFTGGAQPTFVLPGIQPPPGPSPENLQKGDII